MIDRERKQKWVAIAVAIVACLVAAPAQADRLVLTNGNVIHGRLGQIEKGGLRFLSDRFGPMAVEMGAVTELDVEGRVIVGFANGDRVDATRLRMEDGVVFLDSALGVVRAGAGDIIVVTAQEESAGDHARKIEDKTAAATASGEALKASEAEPAHEVSLGFSVLGNQVSEGILGVRRTHVAATTLGYRRLFEGGDWIGVSIPAVYQINRLSDIEGESRRSQFGLGDIYVYGHKAFEMGEDGPVLGLGLHASAPTGRNEVAQETTVLNLGSGHWAVGSSVDLTVPTGFGALTGSVGYTKFWPRTIHGDRIAPAGEISWNVGYSIQLNKRVMLTNSFNGTIAGHTRTNGVSDPLSKNEPAYYDVSITYLGDNGVVLRPQFALGLNTDARDYMVGFEIAKQW